MRPTISLPGWPGCGRVGDRPPEGCSQGRAANHPRRSESSARPSRLRSAPGRGGSAPAASGPSLWPQEALEVQNKINSLNPSNFLHSRSAGGRPTFCGLQRAFASGRRCLCFDDYIPETCLWCFSVPTNNIWKTSHRGPKLSPMASAELLLVLKLLVWIPAPRHSRRFGGREPRGGWKRARQHTSVPAARLATSPSWTGIQLLRRKCQQFHAQTRIRKSFKPAELRKQMEMKTVSLYSCGEVLCGFLSFLKGVMLFPYISQTLSKPTALSPQCTSSFFCSGSHL